VSKSANYAGRIQIYSTPSALIQHIEWAINQALGQVHSLSWVNQPLNPGSKAMEFEYKVQMPIAAKLSTALKAWHYIRFEVREINKNTQDSTFYRATPELGLHQVSATTNGDVVLNENQINTILKNSLSYEKLQANLENALGVNWDIELEPYRIALASGMLDSVSKSG
jgi:hypothetical protein